MSERTPSPSEGPGLHTVRVLPCPPAPREGLARRPAITPSLRGGVLTGGGAPTGPPPAASRRAGHGRWARPGTHPCRAFVRAHGVDDQGRLVRITDVTTHPRLAEGANPGTPAAREPSDLAGEGADTSTAPNPAGGPGTGVPDGRHDVTPRPMAFAD